jgi:beta-N-acetylhexosaminidase
MTAPAGQLLLVGFEGKTAPPELLERIADGRIGGVVLFARNLGEPLEIVALTSALHAAAPAGPPLIVALDQEGGRVQRVKAPLPHWPPMARLGAADDEALSQAVGRAFGDELEALGFNVDFAPVLDVHTNPHNPAIGDRAFASEPERAARHALAFWRGLEAAGVRGCGKHFPGHGDTATDSHLELPRVDRDLETLERVELLPFARAAEAGMPMLMTAHVVYPQVDPQPATLSERWLSSILRGELGFRGVVVSDDLDMKAIAAHFDLASAVVSSLRAGVDCFLACRDPRIQSLAEAALERSAGEDAAVARCLEQSLARMQELRATLVGPAEPGAFERLPLAEHHALAERFQ